MEYAHDLEGFRKKAGLAYPASSILVKEIMSELNKPEIINFLLEPDDGSSVVKIKFTITDTGDEPLSPFVQISHHIDTEKNKRLVSKHIILPRKWLEYFYNTDVGRVSVGEIIGICMHEAAHEGRYMPHEEENHADMSALWLLYHLGYNPWDYIRALEKINELDTSGKSSFTHPAPANRIRDLRKVIDEYDELYQATSRPVRYFSAVFTDEAFKPTRPVLKQRELVRMNLSELSQEVLNAKSLEDMSELLGLYITKSLETISHGILHHESIKESIHRLIIINLIAIAINYQTRLQHSLLVDPKRELLLHADVVRLIQLVKPFLTTLKDMNENLDLELVPLIAKGEVTQIRLDFQDGFIEEKTIESLLVLIYELLKISAYQETIHSDQFPLKLYHVFGINLVPNQLPPGANFVDDLMNHYCMATQSNREEFERVLIEEVSKLVQSKHSDTELGRSLYQLLTNPTDEYTPAIKQMLAYVFPKTNPKYVRQVNHTRMYGIEGDAEELGFDAVKQQEVEEEVSPAEWDRYLEEARLLILSKALRKIDLTQFKPKILELLLEELPPILKPQLDTIIDLMFDEHFGYESSLDHLDPEIKLELLKFLNAKSELLWFNSPSLTDDDPYLQRHTVTAAYTFSHTQPVVLHYLRDQRLSLVQERLALDVVAAHMNINSASSITKLREGLTDLIENRVQVEIPSHLLDVVRIAYYDCAIALRNYQEGMLLLEWENCILEGSERPHNEDLTETDYDAINKVLEINNITIPQLRRAWEIGVVDIEAVMRLTRNVAINKNKQWNIHLSLDEGPYTEFLAMVLKAVQSGEIENRFQSYYGQVFYEVFLAFYYGYYSDTEQNPAERFFNFCEKYQLDYPDTLHMSRDVGLSMLQTLCELDYHLITELQEKVLNQDRQSVQQPEQDKLAYISGGSYMVMPLWLLFQAASAFAHPENEFVTDEDYTNSLLHSYTRAFTEGLFAKTGDSYFKNSEGIAVIFSGMLGFRFPTNRIDFDKLVADKVSPLKTKLAKHYKRIVEQFESFDLLIDFILGRIKHKSFVRDEILSFALAIWTHFYPDQFSTSAEIVLEHLSYENWDILNRFGVEYRDPRQPYYRKNRSLSLSEKLRLAGKGIQARFYKNVNRRRIAYSTALQFPFISKTSLYGYRFVGMTNYFVANLLAYKYPDLDSITDKPILEVLTELAELVPAQSPARDIYVEAICMAYLEEEKLSVEETEQLLTRVKDMVEDKGVQENLIGLLFSRLVRLRDDFYLGSEQALDSIHNYFPDPSVHRDVFLEELLQKGELTPFLISQINSSFSNHQDVKLSFSNILTHSQETLLGIIDYLKTSERYKFFKWLVTGDDIDKPKLIAKLEKLQDGSLEQARVTYFNSPEPIRLKALDRLMCAKGGFLARDLVPATRKRNIKKMVKLLLSQVDNYADSVGSNQRIREILEKSLFILNDQAIVASILALKKLIFSAKVRGEQVELSQMVVALTTSLGIPEIAALQIAADSKAIKEGYPEIIAALERQKYDARNISRDFVVKIFEREQQAGYLAGWEIVKLLRRLGNASTSVAELCIVRNPQGEERLVVIKAVQQFAREDKIHTSTDNILKLVAEYADINLLPANFEVILARLVEEEVDLAEIAVDQRACREAFARLAFVFPQLQRLRVPEIYAHSKRLTIEEYMPGEVMAKIPQTEVEDVELVVIEAVAALFLANILNIDPHKGNKIVAEMAGTLASIDFGKRIRFSLNPHHRQFFISLLNAVLKGNTQAINQLMTDYGLPTFKLDPVINNADPLELVEKLREYIFQIDSESDIAYDFYKFYWLLARLAAYLEALPAPQAIDLLDKARLALSGFEEL